MELVAQFLKLVNPLYLLPVLVVAGIGLIYAFGFKSSSHPSKAGGGKGKGDASGKGRKPQAKKSAANGHAVSPGSPSSKQTKGKGAKSGAETKQAAKGQKQSKDAASSKQKKAPAGKNSTGTKQDLKTKKNEKNSQQKNEQKQKGNQKGKNTDDGEWLQQLSRKEKKIRREAVGNSGSKEGTPEKKISQPANKAGDNKSAPKKGGNKPTEQQNRINTQKSQGKAPSSPNKISNEGANKKKKSRRDE